eukprot:881900-Pyramimonas_sp.AAC.1
MSLGCGFTFGCRRRHQACAWFNQTDRGGADQVSHGRRRTVDPVSGPRVVCRWAVHPRGGSARVERAETRWRGWSNRGVSPAGILAHYPVDGAPSAPRWR